MEEALILVIQGIFELFLQMLAYSGLEWSVWGRDRDDDLGCSYVFVFLILGMLFGGLMNWIHPRLITPWPAVRVAGIIVWPIVFGAMSWLIADYRRKRGTNIHPKTHFITAFCFVLGFDLIRFVFGTR
jgi:hypothetical protein